MKLIEEYKKAPPILGMVYINLSNQLACIDREKKISYISLKSMRIEKQLQGAFDGHLTSIALNKKSHIIAVGDDAGEIKLFSNLDGKLVHLD
mmetsp:Transcript_11123/g.18663  ORF Transcript_11123/g.18663 Transcript_11123/m.18663 type:complete len:92 (+) Transcript_11123:1585-1860(+)